MDSQTQFIDTHCHLDFAPLNENPEKYIKRAQAKGITKIINIGTSLDRSQKSISLAEKNPHVYATVGLHPSEANESFRRDSPPERLYQKLKTLAQHLKVVAIGECGLDYFRIEANHEAQIKTQQKVLFEMQIKLAKELKLPLVVHSRQAFAEVIEMLDKNQFPFSQALFHCWSYGEDEAKKAVDLGCFFAFNAILTYPNAQNVQESLKSVPDDKLLLETDAPFLSPQSKRGEKNEPANLVETALTVAKLKQLSLEELAKKTTNNAFNFFKLLESGKI